MKPSSSMAASRCTKAFFVLGCCILLFTLKPPPAESKPKPPISFDRKAYLEEVIRYHSTLPETASLYKWALDADASHPAIVIPSRLESSPPAPSVAIPAPKAKVDPKKFLERANRFKKKKQWKKAENAYRKALALDPAWAEAHLELGKFYMERKKFKRAEREIKKALKLEPKLAQAHNLLGVVYTAQNKMNHAEREFKKAVKSQPRDVESLLSLAHFYFYFKNDLLSAQGAYKTVLNLSPNMKAAIQNLKAIEKEMQNAHIKEKYFENENDAFQEYTSTLKTPETSGGEESSLFLDSEGDDPAEPLF